MYPHAQHQSQQTTSEAVKKVGFKKHHLINNKPDSEGPYVILLVSGRYVSWLLESAKNRHGPPVYGRQLRK
jgi:hypothetical protein